MAENKKSLDVCQGIFLNKDGFCTSPLAATLYLT